MNGSLPVWQQRIHHLMGLSLMDRMFYLEIPFYWLTHIHLLFLLLAPSLYGFYGYNVFNCTTEELFKVIVPKNILICTAFFWISNGRCMPIVTPVQRTVCLFHTLPSIFRGLINPDSARFNVTNKDITHKGDTFHWRIAAPFIAFGISTFLATAKTFSQSYSVFYWSDYSAYNVMLSGYSLIVIFLCCLVCVDKPASDRDITSEAYSGGSWTRTSWVLTRRIFT